MAGPAWFYYPFDQLDTELLELTGDEANHILGARRMRPGDELALCNGRGKLAHCTLDAADKRARMVRLRVSLVAQLEPPVRCITLASALPKGDRLATMLDMCCQLGMTRFQPLEFEYSVSRWNDKIAARCERILVESCKQSKTPWVPELGPSMTYRDYISRETDDDTLVLVSDQFGCPAKKHASGIESAHEICLVIGPEGGLSEIELKLAQDHGVPLIRLADAILRVETAAAGAVAAVNGVI